MMASHWSEGETQQAGSAILLAGWQNLLAEFPPTNGHPVIAAVPMVIVAVPRVIVTVPMAVAAVLRVICSSSAEQACLM